MAAFLRIFRSKSQPPAVPTTSFKDRIILITGANTGLGFDAARHFLRLQARHVIIGVRTVAKGEAARTRLEQDTGKKGIISILPLDMNDFASVKTFADKISRDFDQVDVAILNAGVMNRRHTQSPYGFEETLQVNTLATSLLALLLLPLLRKTREVKPTSLPHMVLVSSGLHSSVKRNMLPVPSQHIIKQLSTSTSSSFDGRRQYSISKLLLMWNIVYLARLGMSKYGTADVLITSCCPGFCKSDLGRQYDEWYMRLIMWIVGLLFQRTTEEGSRTLVSAAALGKDAQGGYWKNDRLLT